MRFKGAGSDPVTAVWRTELCTGTLLTLESSYEGKCRRQESVRQVVSPCSLKSRDRRHESRIMQNRPAAPLNNLKCSLSEMLTARMESHTVQMAVNVRICLPRRNCQRTCRTSHTDTLMCRNAGMHLQVNINKIGQINDGTKNEYSWTS